MVSTAALVKTPPRQLVAVIASAQELRTASRLRKPPDLFELRLDAFAPAATPAAPFIITARHPAEGGKNNLSSAQRRGLLLRYMTLAAYVDVELRSVKSMQLLLDRARAERRNIIISAHLFEDTPAVATLLNTAASARAAGADIVKIATRTDSQPQLDRLLEFFDEASAAGSIAAMGIGRLGKTARSILLERGSALNYVHLGRAAVAGQMSLAEARRLQRRV